MNTLLLSILLQFAPIPTPSPLLDAPPAAIMPSLPLPPMAANAPLLLSMAHRKSNTVIVFVHPTAEQFSIRIVWWDDSEADRRIAVIRSHPADRLPNGTWTAKVKMLGDTNRISVAPIGTTDWSNEMTRSLTGP